MSFTQSLHACHQLRQGGLYASATDDDLTAAIPAEPISAHSRLRRAVTAVQAITLSVLVDVLVVLLLIVLVWVVFGVGRDVFSAVTSRSVDAFKHLSVEILTVFVFIELFHSLSSTIAIAGFG